MILQTASSVALCHPLQTMYFLNVQELEEFIQSGSGV